MSKKQSKRDRARLRELGVFPDPERRLLLRPTGQNILYKAKDGTLQPYPILEAFNPYRRALRALKRGEDPVAATRMKGPEPSLMSKLFGSQRQKNLRAAAETGQNDEKGGSNDGGDIGKSDRESVGTGDAGGEAEPTGTPGAGGTDQGPA